MNTTENPPTETMPDADSQSETEVPSFAAQSFAEEIVSKSTEQIAILMGRKWPEIQRILDIEEEIKLSFGITITNRDTAPGEQADKSNRLKVSLSFSERFTDTIEITLDDPSQPSLPLFTNSPEQPFRSNERAEPAEFSNTDGEGTKEDLGRIEDVPGAGQTSVGAALDVAAVKTEQSLIVIPGFEETDWQSGALLKAYRSAAKKAGWSEVAISALRAELFKLDVDAMKVALRPHVVAGQQSFEQMFVAAKADYGDQTKLRGHFARILAAFPEQYPGGDSEQNLNKFLDDIASEVEADIQVGRTTEGGAE